MAISQLAPDCIDSRPCFAITYRRGGFRVCQILTESYKKDGACPFCKSIREVTNDAEYPYNNSYGRHRV